MAEFRTRLRAKPGSIMANGQIVPLGVPANGPWEEHTVVIPTDCGTSLGGLLARCEAYTAAGWLSCPAALQPRILNRDEFCLIHRDSMAMRAFRRLTPKQVRQGRGR